MTPDRELHLAPEAASRVRAEIGRADGNEVSFVLEVSNDGELREPRVVARGNSSAVLAAVRSFHPGDILLHNHPSSQLAPSHADLAVAERLWSEGLGFAITDNEASRLYVVVAPPEQRRLEPIDLDALDVDLAPGGVLSRAHSAYEDRPDQRDMARRIARLYHREGIALVEAGTGIGKSVAYLLPAVRWAAINGERTVISTNTINLQEQLVRKDLPFLRRALGVPFRYALVKGRNNYVSIRRAKLAASSAASLFDDGRAAELGTIVEWIETTDDGSLSDLPFRPAPEVWDEVASEADVCLRARCPHFEQCFYQRSRRDAATADILVVNHHLLFADLAVRQAAGNYDAPAVLPHYSRLILDEAHNLEDTATRHLGASVSRRGLGRLLRRIETGGKGVLPALEKSLASRAEDLLVRSCLDLIQERLRPELEGAWKRGFTVFRHLETLARAEAGGMIRIDDSFVGSEAWTAGVEEDLAATLAHLDTLVRGLQALREKISIDESAAKAFEEQLLEVRGIGNRLETAAQAFRSALGRGHRDDPLVRWLEYRAPPPTTTGGEVREGNVIVAAAPLDLGEVLHEVLWERIPTVALTSATLATREGFSFVRGRLGLGDELAVDEAIHPSPFDFSRQALIAVPNDLPLPTRDDDGRHAEAAASVVEELANVTDGGLFVLFTSYRSLRRMAASLRGSTKSARWPLFVQGEGPRAKLIEGFIESGRGILLGTDSFWEGVDVPGHPLRGIVIPKLPFKVPSEPVTAARIEAIEARGGNAFTSYMLPHAAIRLKQGFGRLIRSRSDRGGVVILDGRIVTKSYGSYLLDSLPPARVIVDPWADCLDELTRFYGQG
ncbi:MAG: helicase [Gemmatimonas sp.]|nr:helicase [Gemmatimonas sp.]